MSHDGSDAHFGSFLGERSRFFFQWSRFGRYMNRGRWRQIVRSLIKLFHFPEISHVEFLLNELGEKGFGDNVQTKGGFLNRQHNVVCSSRDRICRGELQDGSMVELLVIGLKTSLNHIGLGSALETGGWQFRD
ncbi:hypothetical protein TNCV_3093371 [Trichonephila clavipes]|nr:hypothetical protein TNCV_3093371 [Trichonephila clavipes]